MQIILFELLINRGKYTKSIFIMLFAFLLHIEIAAAEVKHFTIQIGAKCEFYEDLGDNKQEKVKHVEIIKGIRRCDAVLPNMANKFSYCAVTGLSFDTSKANVMCRANSYEKDFEFVIDYNNNKDEYGDTFMFCNFACVSR